MIPRLLRREYDHGGVSAIITGETGSGKTTFMLSHIIYYILYQHPKRYSREYLFWRGQSSCQWAYIPFEKIKLLLDPMYEYKLVNRETGEELDLDSLGLKYEYCEDLEDFYRYAETHMLNIFYMELGRFIDFLHFLNNRHDINWISIFYDELQDLAEPNAPGELWLRNKKLADQLANTRKNYINFYATTHSLSSVDYRVVRKIKYRVYLKNAKIPRDSIIRNKLLTRNPKYCSIGKAIIEGSEFRMVEFKPLQKQMQLLIDIREA